MSDTSSSSSNDEDGSAVQSPPPSPSSKPHLDPRAVMVLASKIANCTHITPPDERASTAANATLGSASSGYLSSFATFSTFSHTFSTEAGDNTANRELGGDDVLSFLVSDAFSIEQLAAEAEGKHASTSELDGAGMARVDVYCGSGTVITCRVVQTPTSGEDLMQSRTGSTLTEAPSFVKKMLPPLPKGDDDTEQPIIIDVQKEDYQIRRIIKRKCTLDALRKILEQPPKLPDINASIISDIDDDEMSVGSTVSKALRRRRQKRLKGGSKGINLSKKQEKFVKKQQRSLEQRRQKDEKAREQMANAILAGGIEGAEGVDLASVKSLSLEDSIPAVQTSESMGSTGTSRLPASEAYETQRAIQDKIEIADMGLAILMAEAQRLERMMSAMHEKERLERGDDGGDDEGVQDNPTDQSASSEEGEDDSSVDTLDSEAEKVARIMQGCDVTYSFPHQFHNVLEAALMGEDVKDEDSDSSYDSDEDSISYVSKQMRRQRGRSPPKMGGHRQEEIYPIVAVPTNGEGCVVLRESGAFDVVGKIPTVLQKKLFRPNGPLPDQIALGTLGRYYVHFTDGSICFYGPPSLNKALKKAKKHESSIASVAFGPELDDWFVVFSDGSWEANGDIPSGLDELMNNRKGRADLLWVALGVNDEWCVSARNGRVWWDGVSDEADEALSSILAEGDNELRWVDFGPDETYFLLHK